ncbi:protein rep [Candidatus Pacearchaeota archaeon]|nr:protein rep [Candidatus Pacearchaeota archaeon]
MSETEASLVHTIETTSPNRMPRTYRTHSESACREEVDATREVYSLLTGKNRQRRLDSFDTCRVRAWFIRHRETGDLRVATKSCKLRWCPLCAKKRSWFLVEQIKPWAESVHRLKFLTLTLKHSDAPLHDQIDNLYKFFQKFRKLKYLKDNMYGGVWFFQIKKSKASGQWHPHLHCLIDAAFMEREKLSRLWQRTTLTSMVVDIRKAGDPDKVAEYVGRYSARPSTLAELSIDDRLEVVEALHGRRLVGTWGSAKDTSLAMKKPDDADSWKYVGGWSTVWGCLNYDDNAKKIFNAWKNDKPLDADIDMFHIEKGIYNLSDYVPKEPPENRQLYLFSVGPLF